MPRVVIAWLSACVEEPLEPLEPAPVVTDPLRIPTPAEYTQACEDLLGPIPALSCDAVPEVLQDATLEDGTTRGVLAPEDLAPGGTCDRPSILSGCTPGSRAGVVTNERGSSFWLLCRVRRWDTPEGLFDDIALIGRAADGDTTCSWGVPEDGARRDGERLPKPGSDGFWADPETLAAIGCRSCHDGNAIVVTPWIAANLPPVDPAGTMTQPFSEAFATIDPTWAGTPLWTHPDAASCRTCHELPEGPTCAFGPDATGRLPEAMRSPALASWPTDRWMDDLDPDVLLARHGTEDRWEETHGAAADRLMACCGGLREGCWSDP